MASPPTPDLDRASSLLKKRTRALFRWLPRALAGEEEAVHQVRMAGRRLRIALALLARKPKGRRVRRALRVLRELTRAAGASRDLDVSVDLFGERLETLGALPEERAVLRRRCARPAAAAARGWPTPSWTWRSPASGARAVLSRRADDPFRILRRVRDARDEEGEALLAGVAAIGDRCDPEGLHRLRGRARRLHYTAEVSDGVRGQDSEAPTLLKEAQEQLGLVHDNHVLAVWLEGQAVAAARGNPPVATEAGAQAAFFEEASRGFHRAFLERRPLESIRQALQAMGQIRSAAVASHEAQRMAAVTPTSDGPMTFPLRNRSEAS